MTVAVAPFAAGLGADISGVDIREPLCPADRDAIRVMEDCDLSEALRLLVRERGAQMLLVTDRVGALQGIVTKTDILRAVRMASDPPRH